MVEKENPEARAGDKLVRMVEGIQDPNRNQAETIFRIIQKKSVNKCFPKIGINKEPCIYTELEGWPFLLTKEGEGLFEDIFRLYVSESLLHGIEAIVDKEGDLLSAVIRGVSPREADSDDQRDPKEWEKVLWADVFRGSCTGRKMSVVIEGERERGLTMIGTIINEQSFVDLVCADNGALLNEISEALKAVAARYLEGKRS